MEKSTVIERLNALPGLIHEQEKALIAAMETQAEFENKLKAKEAELLLSGAIDGKNAEIRAAQMAEKTAAEKAGVKQAEKMVADMRVKLNAFNNEFKALQSIARLLVSEVA